MNNTVGIVIIGRNEGLRLEKCFGALNCYTSHVVYVDSGSNDGSIDLAKSFNMDVVELDLSIPFSAGRARNAGYRKLIGTNQDIKFIQFLDGDCQVIDDWLEKAEQFLTMNQSVAVVTGHCLELFPEKTIYNKLCDIEWAGPVGKINASGGNFMIRVDAFNQIGGFNQEVIAGEEPELGFRLRKHGWDIYRIDKNMVYHDVDMSHFSQWWIRAKRSGYAYAQGFSLHFKDRERFRLHECLRIWIWALFIPLTILSMTLMKPYALGLFLIYPIQIIRTYFWIRPGTNTKKVAFIYSLFLTIGKWPEFLGQIKFFYIHLTKHQHQIIEHKDQ